MATYDNGELLALCHALFPDDHSLAEEVRLAIEQPDVYRATVQPYRRLQRTGDNGDPSQDLPWMAFLNGLLERDQLVLLDWRAQPREVMQQIDHLMRAQPPDAERWSWMDGVDWEWASTEAFLEAIGRQLQSHHVVLVYVPLDADMYPVAVVDEDRFPAVQHHAKLTGYGSLEPYVSGGTGISPR